MAEKDVPVVKYGDVTQRVGVEVIRKRGVDVEKLIKMLIANAAAEFASTYYYYTILRMHLAGHEDYKEICEDARLEDRAHWELIVPRIYELGGELPNDLPAFHDQAGCRAAKLPDPPTAVNILTLLLESERCAIRSWIEDLRHDLRQRSAHLRHGFAHSERRNRARSLVHRTAGPRARWQEHPLRPLPPRRARPRPVQQECRFL